MTAMNISLPDDLKAFVEDRVAQEGYASASEYFHKAGRDSLSRPALRQLGN